MGKKKAKSEEKKEVKNTSQKPAANAENKHDSQSTSNVSSASSSSSSSSASAASSSSSSSNTSLPPKQMQPTQPQPLTLADLAQISEDEKMLKAKEDSLLRYRQSLKAKTPPPKAIVIDRKVIDEQKRLNQEWTHAVDTEQAETRNAILKQNEATSNIALKIVIAVWLLIICGIFYFVWSTIRMGSNKGPHVVDAPSLESLGGDHEHTADENFN
eukprot:TRINITY_DN474_c3_g1_i1.p1 TRINITY_DN474_c3_g1~~TRINITY_DN474_c3_g1_i1.p1  ORF type:complete len:214 (-),score=77.53 TRINITY_DN474_c3_g1_i1:277-918(-)